MKSEVMTVKDGFWRRKVKKINSGTEGTIYSINGRWVVKVYHSADPHRIKKIKALIKMVKKIKWRDRRLIEKYVALPVSMINDTDGNAIGFKMRRFSKHFKQHNEAFFEHAISYDKRYVFACQLARLAEVFHRNKIYIGDFNPKNFLSDKKGNLKMVDADTVDFTYGGTHYKCMAYFPESVTTEVLRKLTREFEQYKTDPTMRIFDEAGDDYSLAYTIFKFLALGSPYACIPAEKPERQRIMEGICPIYKDDKDYSIPPYLINKKHFGRKLNKLFRRIFTENAHVTARKLYKALNSRRKMLDFQFRTIKTYGGEKIF